MCSRQTSRHWMSPRCSESSQSGQNGEPEKLIFVILSSRRFMQQWFPVEVKLKQKVNEADLAKQQMKEMGLDNSCCVQ